MAADVAIELLAGPDQIGPRLMRDLDEAKRLSLAIAYAKESALDAVDLERWCESRRELRLVAGTDFFLTELGVLRRLGNRPGVTCRLYHPLDGRSFHPKLYVIDKPGSRIAYVGSSNLTRGGLFDNVEANVRLEGPADSAVLRSPLEFFENLFVSEFATELGDDYAVRYDELQAASRLALRQSPLGRQQDALRVAESLLVSAYRSRHAARRWLLVVTPENFEVCLRTRTWGRQNEHEVRQYAPGDVFFFHVTGRSRIAAMGMFTGAPYHDSSPHWREMDRGSFPWRIRFVTLGALMNGVSTKETLAPLRQGAPRNWFNGFIQASHSLSPNDFEALRAAFEHALRREKWLAPDYEGAGR